MKIVREPSRVIASVFALCGFVVAVLAGWRAGAGASSILVSGIVAMLACKALGLWAGWAGERAIREFVTNYTASNPVPDLRAAERALLRGESPKGLVDKSVNKAAA